MDIDEIFDKNKMRKERIEKKVVEKVLWVIIFQQ